MGSNRLLAKSWRDDDAPPPEHVYLVQHLIDVYEAADRILASTGVAQLHAIGLGASKFQDRLRRVMLLAAAAHDLGKANDHFQDMVSGRRNVSEHPQGLRHEWVSLLLLERLRDWLLPAVGHSLVDYSIVQWTVAGHHPSINHASPPREKTNEASGPRLRVLAGHPDFERILRFLRKAFSLSEPANAVDFDCELKVGREKVFPILIKWELRENRVWEQLKTNGDWRLVPVAKACLIAADVAGSALPKASLDRQSPEDWITESFSTLPKAGDLQMVVDVRLRGKSPHKFQEDVAFAGDAVALVRAGCGTGKTVAAYLWAAKNHPTRRLYFCYPTTGTATEGYKTYFADADLDLGELGAKLFHGRRDIDIEMILSVGDDSQDSHVEHSIRLDALEAWSTPIVVCTVDTILGLMQNVRKGLFAWPAIAQSAIVFDEIHAYDDRLFGALLAFLSELPGIPALLMTASLPPRRETALREAISKRQQTLRVVPGPTELEALPRYRKAPSGIDVAQSVREAVTQGENVLWVCNTVDRVQAAAGLVADLPHHVYHSRFKYEDRVRQHRKVVEAFGRTNQPGVVAVCSQVAEMSLDLSADLLVTDLAPVPALIQRLGRLNRHPRNGVTKTWIVCEPDSPVPYDASNMEAARNWIAKLPDESISQRCLIDAWESDVDDSGVSVECKWFSGGPQTEVGSLRESTPGITVLMEADEERVKQRPRDLARVLLPMKSPKDNSFMKWRRFRGFPIAPTGTICYVPERGGRWQND